MVFTKLNKISKYPCSLCQEVNDKEISEVYIIEVPAFSTMIRICPKCQKNNHLISNDISQNNNFKIKLRLN